VLPILTVADLHGHRAHLDALLAWADDSLGPHRLVLLGDYCDNGPDVPGLLDRIIALQQARGPGFAAILGNHDLACLRALDDPAWYRQWSTRYWNPGQGTPRAYGAADQAGFRAAFPRRHRALLAGLPWALRWPDHAFVHAGLAPGPLAPQLVALAARRLPIERLHLPPALRDRDLSTASDPAWEATVVSAHDGDLATPLFLGPRRVCLRAEVDRTGQLHALVLPTGPLVTVSPSLHVSTQVLP